jgi:hypothetical protein
MGFKKKKAPLQYTPLTPSDGNPGNLDTSPTPPAGEASDNPAPRPQAPSISEQEIMGYGLIRLLSELQGVREVQLEILAVLKEIKEMEQ